MVGTGVGGDQSIGGEPIACGVEVLALQRACAPGKSAAHALAAGPGLADAGIGDQGFADAFGDGVTGCGEVAAGSIDAEPRGFGAGIAPISRCSGEAEVVPSGEVVIEAAPAGFHGVGQQVYMQAGAGFIVAGGAGPLVHCKQQLFTGL